MQKKRCLCLSKVGVYLMKEFLQAYSLDNLSVQALVLKGSALLDMKKGPQAMQHFQEAVRMAPNRFEAYQGLSLMFLQDVTCQNMTEELKSGLSKLPTKKKKKT